MGFWSGRLGVGRFNLLGGEPTIHPELPSFVSLVRRHWPETFISIKTNGFFLHRHPDLPALLAADGRAGLLVSIHHDSDEYREQLRPIFDLIARWKRQFAIQVDVNQSFANWTRRYQGFGARMQPFEDGAPRASWKICPAREIPNSCLRGRFGNAHRWHTSKCRRHSTSYRPSGISIYATNHWTRFVRIASSIDSSLRRTSRFAACVQPGLVL
jgi:hypothetical protein